MNDMNWDPGLLEGNASYQLKMMGVFINPQSNDSYHFMMSFIPVRIQVNLYTLSQYNMIPVSVLTHLHTHISTCPLTQSCEQF